MEVIPTVIGNVYATPRIPGQVAKGVWIEVCKGNNRKTAIAR